NSGRFQAFLRQMWPAPAASGSSCCLSHHDGLKDPRRETLTQASGQPRTQEDTETELKMLKASVVESLHGVGVHSFTQSEASSAVYLALTGG
ncbi:mCG144584, partial [Mus musculus]